MMNPFIIKQGIAAYSSACWFSKHTGDAFVRDAQRSGYRARSAFKLLQILEKYPTIIRPGMIILDCGAAPGSWSQVAVDIVQKKGGRILAADLLPIGHLPGVSIYQGDISSFSFKQDVLPTWLCEEQGKKKKLDTILSDMCPNISGISDLDSLRSIELASHGLEIATEHLVRGGSFLTKIFTGGYENKFKAMLLNGGFRQVKRIKPLASRKNSSEIFFLGLDFQPA